MATDIPLLPADADMKSLKAIPDASTSTLKPDEVDLESGDVLFPGLSLSENQRRWGFIQKVYGIVAAQLLLTAAVGSCFALIPSWRIFAMTSDWFSGVALLSPFIMFFPLYVCRQSHPANLVLLALWTCSLSITVGLVCSTYQGVVVAEALALTAIVVLSLTAYTFYAVRKGQDFSFRGPMLFAALITLVTWGLIQLFFPLGDVSLFVYSLVGALLFSLYILYDTDSLIKRYSYDEFLWASVNVYLDIINLFLHILRILDRFR